MRISKSAVFLFELMIVILVFVFAAAICTQVFAVSFNASKKSHELTMSSINAQMVAERFKADSPDSGSLYFDRNWNPTDSAGAHYTVALEEQDQLGRQNQSGGQLEDQNNNPGMSAAFVNVYEEGSDTAIYTLYVKRFTG